MKTIYTISLICLSLLVGAQQPVKLNINHKLVSQSFAFQQSSSNNLGNNFDVNRMQYYMSKFTVIHDGGQMTDAVGVYALVDAANATSIDLGSMNVTTVEGIKFYIGVNTPENNNDPSLWASNHPLAPKNPSMHWGWASGYFFVAMSGMGGSNLNNTYELHGLGNSNYFNQTITTGATLTGSDLVITLDADYAQALKNINVASGIISHGETGQAATIIANFRDYVFSAVTVTASTVGIKENSISNNNIIVYPNPSSTGIFNFNWENLPKTSSHLIVTDLTGRQIKSVSKTEMTNSELIIESKGIYFLNLMDGDKTLLTQKVVSL
jgi:hypothetical protein